jgi:hypothetical protein
LIELPAPDFMPQSVLCLHVTGANWRKGWIMASEISLDLARLENIKPQPDGSIRAACPACRSVGSDKSCNHLLIEPDGKFGCAKNPGDGEHRKEIFKLAGNRTATAPGTNGSPKQLDCVYNYRDANGEIVFQVVRFKNPKTFRQRRPDGKCGWAWNMKGIAHVLYRLPDILKAKAGGKPILIAEGEKDSDCLAKHGFTATTNVGGAGKWIDAYNEILRDCDCIIIADKDGPGQAHAQLVASNLHGIAKSVRILELPDTNGKPVKDAHDFFAAGGTQADLIALADAEPEWTPQAEPVADSNYSDAASEYLAEDTEQPQNGLPDVIDAVDFLATPIDSPAEIVEGILHQGSKLVLGGSSKSFKTWNLLDLAISVASGADWLGRRTSQGKVLFLNFEIQPHAWQRRIIAVTRAKGVEIATGQIILWNLRGHAADYRQLIPQIIERAIRENFALIVLDPIYKLYGGADENKASDIAALLNALEKLATQTGAAIAFGAHFAKGNASGKESIDRISGSGVFARDPDSLLILTKHEEEDAFSVDAILRNFPPVKPFVVRWIFPLMQRADELDPKRLKKAGGRNKAHDPKKLLATIISTTPENPISVKAWARAADIPRQTLADYVPEMRKRGWVKTVGEGKTARQCVTVEGKAFIDEGEDDGN